MSNPFDFVNDINQYKTDIMKKGYSEDDYNPFLTNVALSLHNDTIHYAQFINEHSNLPKRLQYRFYLTIVPKRKRFGQWPKKLNNEAIELLCTQYGYSIDRAREALKILSDEQINDMIKGKNKGGLQ